MSKPLKMKDVARIRQELSTWSWAIEGFDPTSMFAIIDDWMIKRDQLEAQSVTYMDNLTEIQMLKHELSALPPAMTWTTEKPTKPGHYWYRNSFHSPSKKPFVREITHYDIQQNIWAIHGEWAGPMEPPQ